MRESDKRLLALDRRCEGERKLDELGEHDALEFDSIRAGERGRRGAKENDASAGEANAAEWRSAGRE